MKNVILIISMILVPFKFCLAQDLDVDKVLNNWDSVYNGFITELQKDELFPDIKKNRNPLYCRIANKDYFKNGIPPDGKSKRWEIIKDHYKS